MSWHLTKIVLYQRIISINQFNNVSTGFHFCSESTLTMQQLGNLILLYSFEFII